MISQVADRWNALKVIIIVEILLLRLFLADLPLLVIIRGILVKVE